LLNQQGIKLHVFHTFFQAFFISVTFLEEDEIWPSGSLEPVGDLPIAPLVPPQLPSSLHSSMTLPTIPLSLHNFFSLQVNHHISSIIMKEFYDLFTSSAFHISDFSSDFLLDKAIFGSRIPDIFQYTFFDSATQQTIYVASIISLLHHLLMIPDFCSCISQQTGEEGWYSTIQSGSWFKKNLKVGEILLALILSYDPWKASNQNSLGSILLTIGNLCPEIYFSPHSKWALCYLPFGADISPVLAIIQKELLWLESNLLHNSFRAKLCCVMGDSHDLHHLCGMRNFQSLSPCRMCWIEKSKLSIVNTTYSHKSKQQLLKLYFEFKEIEPMAREFGMISAFKQVFKMFGIIESLSIPVMLQIPSFDPCIQSPACFLHNEQLGMVKSMLLQLKEKLSNTQKKQINQLLSLLPPPKNGAYLRNGLQYAGMFQGPECHTAIWNLPYVLHQVIDETSPLYIMISYHIIYYRYLSRIAVSTEDIKVIKELITNYRIYAQQLFPDLYSSTQQPYNFHLSVHWPEYIVVLGMARWYSNQATEHKNKISRQRKINMTNNKNQSKELLKLDLSYTFTTFKDNLKLVVLKEQQPTVIKLLNIQTKTKEDDVYSFWTDKNLPHFWKGVKINNKAFHIGDIIVVHVSGSVLYKIIEIIAKNEEVNDPSRVFFKLIKLETVAFKNFDFLRSVTSTTTPFWMNLLSPFSFATKVSHPEINSGNTVVDILPG
jgi:hypothetical protein